VGGRTGSRSGKLLEGGEGEEGFDREKTTTTREKKRYSKREESTKRG